MKYLDEKGFVFTWNYKAWRACMWGEQAWLFVWRDRENCWESIRPLTQSDLWLCPHNLTEEQQEYYFKLEARKFTILNPILDSPEE